MMDSRDRVVLALAAMCGMLCCALVAYLSFNIGMIEGRQSVEAVACQPTVVGLRKNGKEIPLTSAQRDSLARRP